MKISEKKIALLGSSGSIGTQTLDVVRDHGIRVDALAVNTSVALLEKQIREFSPRFCAVGSEAAADDLRIRIADTDTKIFVGQSGITEMICCSDADTVVNALTGKAGLLPSVTALESGKALALANKETLVCAGERVSALARENGLPVMPIDSEHSAIFQCLRAGRDSEVNRLIITASGGPFFGKTRKELTSVTPEQALDHPTWKMGKRITVDSATLFNKAFEMLEAAYLYSVDMNKIDVVVHKESIIHSMVEFCDGAVMAQMGLPDMRLCIRYALSFPERAQAHFAPLDLGTIGKLSFAHPDRTTFRSLNMAERVYRESGIRGALFNSADETAVSLFLQGKIGFCDIWDIVEEVTFGTPNKENADINDITDAGALAHEKVLALI